MESASLKRTPLYTVHRDIIVHKVAGKRAGWVPGGSRPPTLNQNLGLCYLPIEAEIVPTPFYQRKI